MADEITVRLRLRAEEFSAEARKAFSNLPDEAGKAGAQAGEQLARGFARAEPIIESYARAQAQATRTVQEARTAYKAGDITLEQYKATQLEVKAALTLVKAEHSAVTAELNREAKAALAAGAANDNVTASAGAQRAGMQQLGFQVQDYAVQVAGGTSATRAFAQQFPQAVGAMQLMIGTGGRLASFFAGPWGIALITAGTVAAALAQNLFETEEAAEASADANETLAEKLDLSRHSFEDVVEASRAYNREQEQARVTTLAAAKAAVEAAKANIQEAQSIRQKLAARLAEQQESSRVLAGTTPTSSNTGLRITNSADIAARQTRAEIAANNQAIADLRATSINAVNEVAQIQSRIATDPSFRIEQDFIEKRAAAARRYKGDLEGLTAAYVELNKQEEAAKKAAERDERTGRPGRSRRTGKSEEQREAERAAREALRERERAAEAAARAEERFADSVARSLDDQEAAARVEQIRLEQGDAAAAAEEARLAFIRQNPEAIAATVAQLANMLGIEGEITDEKRAQLQLLIDQADAAEKGESDAARKRVEDQQARERNEREKKRIADLVEEERRQRDDMMRDLSAVYEDLFSGRSENIVRNFKRMFLGAISEIAAQYTLALISGQSAGNLGDIAGASFGKSPLFGILGGGASTSFGVAANDNPVSYGFPGVDFSGTPGIMPGDQPTGYGFPGVDLPGAKTSILDSPGFALAASSLFSIAGGANNQYGQIGSLAGSLGGQALGSSLAALGAFGGPLGAVGGAILGGLFGNEIGKLLNPNRTARALVTGPGSVDVAGKDKGNYGAASGLGGSLLDGLQQIADALGADLGNFYTTIGVRGGDFRVNTDGTSLKKKNGAIDFDGDQEAAIRFAIADALADGAIKGISDASQRILKEGSGNLEEAIEKAVLIESIPKLLRERLDPLGAALDAIDEKFRKVADALREGGASAEQIAQARELWKLEREDTISQIGDASESLKTFLNSLNAGSNSPLSLRQQRAEAEAQLKPYIDQIRDAEAAQAELDRLKASGASASDISAAEEAARLAAGKIDQQGFQSASQLLLGLARQTDASGGGFFAEFDRIRQLTGSAIGLIDSAVKQPGEGNDPFSELTAQHTKDTAEQLAETNKKLDALIQLTGQGRGYAGSDWFWDARQYQAA